MVAKEPHPNEFESSLPSFQVLLFHSEKDREVAIQAGKYLAAAPGFKPFLPEPGLEDRNIKDDLTLHAIRNADFILFFLTRSFQAQSGGGKLNTTLEYIHKQTEGGNNRIIFLRLEDCETPKVGRPLASINLCDRKWPRLHSMLESRIENELNKTVVREPTDKDRIFPGRWAHRQLESLVKNHVEKFRTQSVALFMDGLDSLLSEGAGHEDAEAVIQWLGGLRSKMDRYPLHHLKLVTTMSAAVLSSAYSHPLLAQNLNITLSPLDERMVEKMMNAYGLVAISRKEAPDMAGRLAAYFNGHPYLIHCAINFLSRNTNLMGRIREIPFPTIREFANYEKNLDKIFKASLVMRRLDDKYEELKDGLVKMAEDPSDPPWIIYETSSFLNLLGILNGDMKLTCDYYKDLFNRIRLKRC